MLYPLKISEKSADSKRDVRCYVSAEINDTGLDKF